MGVGASKICQGHIFSEELSFARANGCLAKTHKGFNRKNVLLLKENA